MTKPGIYREIPSYRCRINKVFVPLFYTLNCLQTNLRIALRPLGVLFNHLLSKNKPSGMRTENRLEHWHVEMVFVLTSMVIFRIKGIYQPLNHNKLRYQKLEIKYSDHSFNKPTTDLSTVIQYQEIWELALNGISSSANFFGSNMLLLFRKHHL